ncbi:MAG TPA: cobalamin biosynthesis protein [Pseudomonas sp.]|uniref:cobalamin biosynthesis protein n=1 Tax=Pseudomonas sp. TaxID=306 RepID=UPI002ED8A779
MIPPGNSPILVAGLGCRRGCSADSLLELIDHSLKREGLTVQAITALASIDLKASEPGLLELAETLGLPLVFFSAYELSVFDGQLTHRSQSAFEATGCHGVAESAALALATRLAGSAPRLLIERRKNSHATFALAGRISL